MILELFTPVKTIKYMLSKTKYHGTIRFTLTTTFPVYTGDKKREFTILPV